MHVGAKGSAMSSACVRTCRGQSIANRYRITYLLISDLAATFGWMSHAATWVMLSISTQTANQQINGRKEFDDGEHAQHSRPPTKSKFRETALQPGLLKKSLTK